MARSRPNCSDAQGDELRKRGNEYGAVTGRPRRTGWLDLSLLRYSGMINGTSWLVVTKLDVLDELAEIPVCVGYKIDGKQLPKCQRRPAATTNSSACTKCRGGRISDPQLQFRLQ